VGGSRGGGLNARWTIKNRFDVWLRRWGGGEEEPRAVRGEGGISGGRQGAARGEGGFHYTVPNCDAYSGGANLKRQKLSADKRKITQGPVIEGAVPP